jgi:hypothetical protein
MTMLKTVKRARQRDQKRERQENGGGGSHHLHNTDPLDVGRCRTKNERPDWSHHKDSAGNPKSQCVEQVAVHYLSANGEVEDLAPQATISSNLLKLG